MSARDNILGRLAGGATPARSEVPPRPALPGEPVARFVELLRELAASVEPLDDIAAVPGAVLRYAQGQALDGPVAVAPVLAALDWSDGLDVQFGSTDGGALLSVSRARAGIAETGSLVMLSGPSTPTRLNFLPDHAIVVLQQAAIVPHLEDALALLGSDSPRALNLVTGPSRTADVEQTIQLGAHGPRALHVLLLRQ